MKSGRGVAFVQYDRTEAYVAAVTDVDVNLANGEVRVKRVVIAHDCGLIINPNGLKKPDRRQCNPSDQSSAKRRS